jgi:aminodeoxyfutalosine synthase
MTTAELVTLIKQVKRKPIERDTLYNEVRDYTNVSMNELTDPQMN